MFDYLVVLPVHGFVQREDARAHLLDRDNTTIIPLLQSSVVPETHSNKEGLLGKSVSFCECRRRPLSRLFVLLCPLSTSTLAAELSWQGLRRWSTIAVFTPDDRESRVRSQFTYVHALLCHSGAVSAIESVGLID